jgi:hypothetical protein
LEDALASGLIVDAWLAAAVAWCEGLQAFDVESCDQVRDGVAGSATGRACGLLVVAAAGDGQEHRGASDLDGRSDLGPAELGESLMLSVGECAERILPAA